MLIFLLLPWPQAKWPLLDFYLINYLFIHLTLPGVSLFWVSPDMYFLVYIVLHAYLNTFFILVFVCFLM